MKKTSQPYKAKYSDECKECQMANMKLRRRIQILEHKLAMKKVPDPSNMVKRYVELEKLNDKLMLSNLDYQDEIMKLQKKPFKNRPKTTCG